MRLKSSFSLTSCSLSWAYLPRFSAPKQRMKWAFSYSRQAFAMRTQLAFWAQWAWTMASASLLILPKWKLWQLKQALAFPAFSSVAQAQALAEQTQASTLLFLPLQALRQALTKLCLASHVQGSAPRSRHDGSDSPVADFEPSPNRCHEI